MIFPALTPIFPGKLSKRENQWERSGDGLLEGIMMRANDIKTQDIPMPLGTYNTVEKFRSAFASSVACLPIDPWGMTLVVHPEVMLTHGPAMFQTVLGW